MKEKIKVFLILSFLFGCFIINNTALYPADKNANKSLNIDQSNEDNVIYFVLKRGWGYKYPDVKSERIVGIKLRFGEVIKYIDKSRYNGLLWYRCYLDGKYFFLPETFVDEKKFLNFELDSNGNIVIGTAKINRIYSIPLSYIPTDLMVLKSSVKAKGYEWRSLKLRAEAKKMFEKMIHDAKINNVSISIISAFRDSKYQSMLYTRAIERNGINEKSVAKPGHSEHQLGTACDLTSDEINYALSEIFDKTVAYDWLTKNSWRYGIFLTYPRLKQRVTGYIYEPWHFRYWGMEHWKRIFSKYKIILR